MEYRLHGANYKKLYKEFDIPVPEKVIDFSTNTNVLSTIYDDVDLRLIISRYPDDTCLALRQALAKLNKVDIDNLLITNGANEAIYMIASLLQGKKVGIIQPTYPEYEVALKAYGIDVSSLFDIKSCKEYDAIFLCNPNNPTGGYIRFEQLKDLVEELDAFGIALILDEAYIDFLSCEHQCLDIKGYKHVYILRSLTKIYHLAGVRIGYVMSNHHNIERLKLRQPTWSVNGLAQALALKYLNDKDFIINSKHYYSSEVTRVINQLRALKYEVLDTWVHYFLLKINRDDLLIKYLLERGMVVRHTRNHKGLNGQYVRIAVRTKSENNQLLEALAEYENTSYKTWYD